AELERICSPGCIVVIDATTRHALQFATAMNRSHPSTRIVAVGLDEDPGQAIAWATAGAVGLVEGNATYEELLNALGEVSGGAAHCSAGISGALLRGIGGGKADRRLTVRSRTSEAGSLLSSREQEVAWLVAGGFTNKEIAERLQISPGTVKSHVHNVIRKLGVVRRGHVAVTLPQQTKLCHGHEHPTAVVGQLPAEVS
ncbi:MAG: response regulator transcription factor, partial [Rhodococcus sp.]|nr:response regulator transcription factor [Rhodococcus sp. (in: high G+C Gram-positive bacteria)]